MKVLEEALKNGCIIHGFRSGGGLRVFRLERADPGSRGDLVGYGESATAEPALTILAEDVKAGGREYHDVYGKLYPHYLTGSSSPGGKLDAFLLRGADVDVFYENGAFVATIETLGEVRTPEDIVKRSTAGETVQFSARGFLYETAPSRFPNGERCCSTRVVKSPPGRTDSWHYREVRTGRGETLIQALADACEALPQENTSE